MANVRLPVSHGNQGFLTCTVQRLPVNCQFNINEGVLIKTSTSCLSRLKLNGILLTVKYISSEHLYYLRTMNFEKLSLIGFIIPLVPYRSIVHRRENELNCCFSTSEGRKE